MTIEVISSSAVSEVNRLCADPRVEDINPALVSALNAACCLAVLLWAAYKRGLPLAP